MKDIDLKDIPIEKLIKAVEKYGDEVHNELTMNLFGTYIIWKMRLAGGPYGSCLVDGNFRSPNTAGQTVLNIVKKELDNRKTL